MNIARMAALGSSFAAGPTLQPVADADAMRSARNYPRLVASDLGADLVDLTVSGATTATILHTPQETVSGRTFRPQVDGVPQDVDLVTITAGGNDLRLIGSMLYAAWAAVEPGGQMHRYLGAELEGGVREASDADVRAVAGGLGRIVATVRDRAPGARVVLVDYLTILSETTPTSDEAPFTARELGVFARLQASLASAYVLASEESGAELLSMSTTSSGHGVGSDQPWVFGFRSSLESTAGSFHPNEAGMRAVADQLALHLGR